MLGTLAAVPSGQCSVGTANVYQLIMRPKTYCALHSLNIWKEHKLVLCSHDYRTIFTIAPTGSSQVKKPFKTLKCY